MGCEDHHDEGDGVKYDGLLGDGDGDGGGGGAYEENGIDVVETTSAFFLNS